MLFMLLIYIYFDISSRNWKGTTKYGNARNHYPGFKSSCGKLQLNTIMTHLKPIWAGVFKLEKINVS